MRVSDLKRVSSIAEACGLALWSVEDYSRQLESVDCCALVAGNGENETIGFIISRLIKLRDSRDSTAGFNSGFDFKTENHPDSNFAGIAAGFDAANNPKKNNVHNVNDVAEQERRECEAEIYSIAVNPEFQSTGAGRALYDAFIESALEDCVKANVWLEVRRSNARAVSFYEANNFKIIYERKNYYTEPIEDALVMKSEINVGKV